MHICHVITRLIIGGAQENTLLTCRGLVERGHRVTLIAGSETGPEGSLWDEARRLGCSLVELPSLRRAVRPLTDMRAMIELRKRFLNEKPDVVHTHSSKAGILGRFAAVRAGVPVIVHTIHGMSFNRTQSACTRLLYRALEREAAAHTDALITVADAMIEQAVEADLAPRDRFATVYSGMETDRFAPSAPVRERVRREWGVGADAVVVGTVARLFANKGYEKIIAAMPGIVAALPNARFVWIGDGAHRRMYEGRLTAMGLRDRVHFVGLVAPARVAELINGFDVVLHASRWEGLPRAVVQGLLTEIPAVSFDNDGAPEVVIPGETGLLVPFGDSTKLANVVVTLGRDAETRRAMGRRGRAMCLDRFDWRRMVDRLERLYLDLMKRRAS